MNLLKRLMNLVTIGFTDGLFQNFSTVQSFQQPQPVTIASAATVAPTGFLTFLTGTTQLATITPPVTGTHMLALCFTNASPGAFLTTGNIHDAYTPVQNRPVFVVFDPVTAKYWVMTVV